MISLVGLMHGSPEDFDRIQCRGARNVARAAQDIGAKLIHFSAIGADVGSDIPYFKTKGLGEEAVLAENPESTIVRPSLVFGPGDGFFSVCNHASHIVVGTAANLNRNSPQCRLSCLSSRFSLEAQLGSSRFMLETWLVLLRSYPATTMSYGVWWMARRLRQGVQMVRANSTELGLGLNATPSLTFHNLHSVFTYYEMMEIVLQCKNRYRPVLSLPYAFGMAQGFIMERLPENIFTLSRDQVRQLKLDNVVRLHRPSFKYLLEQHSSRKLAAVRDVLPTYL